MMVLIIYIVLHTLFIHSHFPLPLPMPPQSPTEDAVPGSNIASVLQWITETEERLSRRNTTSLHDTLKSSSFRFQNPPVDCPLIESFISPDFLELDAESPNNALALTLENWVRDHEHLAARYVAQYANDTEVAPLLNSLLSNLQMDFSQLQELKRSEWERQRNLLEEVNNVDPGKLCKTLLSASY